MDGKQVAPLMGDYRDPDVGTLRVRTLPNFWNHSSCDHGVTTRLLPAGPRTTQARVIWLVDEDAVEGRDYELDEAAAVLAADLRAGLGDLRAPAARRRVAPPTSRARIDVQGIQRRRVRALVREDAGGGGERLNLRSREDLRRHDIVIVGGGADRLLASRTTSQVFQKSIVCCWSKAATDPRLAPGTPRAWSASCAASATSRG